MKKPLSNHPIKIWDNLYLNFKKLKLTKLFFTLILISVCLQSYSQTVKLSLNLNNVSIKDFIDEIEKQTNYVFLYQDEVLNNTKMISLQVNNQPLKEILNKIEKQTSIKTETSGNQIILKKGKISSREKIDKPKSVISGQITDQQGQTLPGVTILIKGTSNGTVSDNNGKFSLKLPTSAKILQFSFVGMETKEIPINGKTTFNIIMENKNIGLNEVVAIGYGTMQKKEVTSSITSVKNKDLIPGVSGNPLIAMQDKVTGLSIQSNNGTSPNAGTSVQMRGVASVLAGQGPLIVIDGVPGGSLNSVSREDIQSIDILKDASAGAIYGTRAAGGVILITTKQAKKGKIKLTYTSEFTTETIRKKPEVLSAKEFLANKLGEDYGHTTNWYDEVTKDFPFRQRHHINLSGGSSTSKIYATLISSNQEGIALGDKKEEIGGRINTNFIIADGLAEINAHADYRETKSDKSNNGIFNQALKLNPTISPYDKTKVHGLNVWTGGWEYYNPIADILLRDDKSSNNYFLGDISLKINISSNLYVKAMAATQANKWRNIYYESAQHKASLDNNRDGYASQGYGEKNDKTFEILGNYLNEIGNHIFGGVAGYSFQEFNGDGFNMNNSNFPVDGINAWDMGKGTYLSTGRAGMGSWKDPRTRLIAFFARGNYSYNDKYMVTLSGRYEGSSKFFKDNRWGLFPALSAGWRISNESFMTNINFINDLKLRGGYGITGNQSFNPGVATRMYSSDTWWLVDNEWIYTYGSAHNQNKNLQWEEKKELNIGIDFALLNNTLSGKFDIYKRVVDKMIYDISVSVPPAIHDKTTMNVGRLENKGWETELSFTPNCSSYLKYNTTIRLSHNKSILKSLWGNQTYWDRVGFPAPGSPGTAVRLYPGQEIGKFYVWQFAGFTEEGNWMLYDKNGEAFDVTKQTKTNEDKAFVGNAIPKIQLSWDHNISYKNWELNLFFTSWLGHDIFNTIDMYYGLPNVEEQNVLKHAFEKNKNVKGEKELCDYWIENADFLKLKALTINYNFNNPKISFIDNGKIYITARNLFTITKYSGMDPESNINGLDPGFEWHNNIYPQTRTWTLGVQLSF